MTGNSGSRRPFATGSKPGPDAVDHYLEEQGFYRKHVARDASSLFRVVSEQVFDIQHYHEKIRQDCAAFMETHPNEYANEIDKNFYNYISQLRRSRTYGSLLELRVLARMYRRNVILFEPTQNLQTTSYLYVSDDSYDSKDPLRVFYSHKDRHFDVIFTMDYVERLAESQSFIYSILYDGVFKLPDVKYAVERMLHDQNEEVTLPLLNDPLKFKTQSGEVLKFDLPSETQCVLKDPKTCHFHNQKDFDDIVNEQKDAITVINRSNDNGKLKVFKPIDGFLFDSMKSCVRQLLDEKITPFPYKVAKALDPSIYRNTEFELWSDNRKEQRLKWLNSNGFLMKPFTDEKWHGDNGDVFGTRRIHDGKFERGFVDESEYMSLDEETKKKYIIIDQSVENFKLDHLTGLTNFTPSKDQLDFTVMPMNVNYQRGGFKKRGNAGRFNNNNHPNNEQYANQHHQSNAPPNQQLTQVGDIERETNHQNQGQWDQQQCHDPCAYEQQLQHPVQMYQVPAQNWSQQMVSYPAMSYQQVMPYGNFTVPPPHPSMVQPVSITDEQLTNGDVMNIMRDSELSSISINWKPKESTEKTGSDLPADVQTLQFYFNVGVRYFLASGVQRRLETVASTLENLELNENQTVTASTVAENGDKGNEQQTKGVKSDKTEAPPVPTNTPVTTKMMSSHYGPPNRFHSNSYGNNYRRTSYNSNRDGRDNRDVSGGGYRGSWNNNRDQRSHKDIKFNSNVKNAPKTGGGGLHRSNSVTTHGGIQTQTYQSNVPPINVAPSPNKTAQEKVSSGNPNFSPVSPIAEGSVQYQTTQEQQMYQSQPVQQCYQTYPPQHAMYPQQPGIAVYYQQMEDGTCVVQQPPPVQYAQQCQYSVPPSQMQSLYYPVQSFTPQIIDGSAISNDSGVVDSSVFQPQTIQYIPQAPFQHQTALPIFYAQSPMPQTPQIAPIFSAPQLGQVHRANSAPLATVTSADRSPPQKSDEYSAENYKANNNA